MKKSVMLALAFLAVISTSARSERMSITETVTAKFEFLNVSLSLFNGHIDEF